MTYHYKQFSYLLTFLILTSQGTIGFAQQPDCEVIHDAIDLQTKQYRLELGPQLLFNYTPPQIKNELQEANLINTSAQIVKVEDDLFLHLNMKVNSLKAQSFYGEIVKDNLLKVILLNGREVTIKCYAGSSGVLSQDRKSYLYPIGYKIERSDARALAKKEIDKIGIQWSSGYEEYTIYEVDFFMNQLTCLKQAEDQKQN